MSKSIKMDRSGRVVIPLAIREKYGLGKGSHRIEILESAEGIVLRPAAEEVGTERHPSGWIVFRSTGKEGIDPSQAVDEARERRHRQVRGNG